MTDIGDYDEEFNAMMESVEIMSDADLTALEDEADQLRHAIRNSSTPELVTMLKEVWVELRALGEGLTPKTDAGRALHSKHTAIKTEMLKRSEQ